MGWVGGVGVSELKEKKREEEVAAMDLAMGIMVEDETREIDRGRKNSGKGY
jgi:hypothetical protein